MAIPEDIMQAAVGVKTLIRFSPEDTWGRIIAEAILAEREKCRMICIDQAGRHAAYKSGKAEADAARACAKVIMGADPFEAYPGER